MSGGGPLPVAEGAVAVRGPRPPDPAGGRLALGGAIAGDTPRAPLPTAACVRITRLARPVGLVGGV